jgi:hypothetical protein
MRKIKLTQGKYALVDDADYDWLNQYKWHAYYSKRTNTFYAVHSISSIKKISMQRMIMNTSTGLHTDHKNGKTLDNRRANLRVATVSQNCMNRKGDKNSTSKFKGVSWNKHAKKWRSFIMSKAKLIYLGSFDSEIDAAKIYNQAAIKYFGNFARLNII